MRVLVFTTLYPNNVWPQHGVFVKERMTSFARLTGSAVKVVAPVPYFPPLKLGWRWRFSQVARRELRDGLEVFHPRYVMTPKIAMASYGLAMFLSTLATVRRIRRSFDFDLIDAHYVYPDGLAAVLLARVFRRPVVVCARGTDINLFSRFVQIRPLLQYTLRRADRVIAVSRSLSDAMVRLGIPEAKISVISDGVQLEKFHPLPRAEARRRLGLPDDRIILSVGNLIPLKGVDLLIRAVERMLQERPERKLSLVIVGEGPAAKDLRRLVTSLGLEDRVRLVGVQPHEELRHWYNAADVFCLASTREGWPNVLLESLACGTPVVATPVGGIPEMIASDRLGLLTGRSPRELALTLDRALGAPWSRDVMVKFAREHTRERETMALLDLFESILTGAGAGAVAAPG
jgi:teichuronic acid biosynthesis glycosyltransferase TuaC